MSLTTLPQKTRSLRMIIASVLLAASLLALMVVVSVPGTTMAQESEDTRTHLVVPGETLYSIAARYGVTVDALARVNDISDVDAIQVGILLVIPGSQDQTGEIHIVRRGETLSEIASLYGVTVEDIVLANDLPSRSYIFVGQGLLIPVAADADEGVPEPAVEEAVAPALTITETLTPTTTPTVAAPSAVTLTREPLVPACPLGCEAITILTPTEGISVTSPLVISGTASPFEQPLVVRVLNADGLEIGLGSAAISGTYSATLTYTEPFTAQLGRIQVYSLSPRDGAIEHLTSVVVTLQGSQVDAVVAQLTTAVEAKDYDALADLVVEPWVLGFYQAEGLVLEAEPAIEQLEENYLGPGDVQVDPAVDAEGLLGEDLTFSSNVVRSVYSTGWGPDQLDDAFLLVVETEDGQIGWGGMLYVFNALRDYPAPEAVLGG